MTSNGRVARLTALALATGTLVAAGASSAGAATTTKTTYTAAGGGNVVSLKLNLPVAIPNLGSTITQDLITSAATARTSGIGTAPAAVSKALLGSNGNIPIISGVLNRGVTAEYGKNGSAQDGGILPANPLLVGGLLTLVGKATNPDVQGSAPVALGKSSVADLKIDGAGNLDAVLNQLVTLVSQNLTGLIGTTATGGSATPVSGVTTTLTQTLGQLAGAVTSATQGTPAADAGSQIAALLNDLPQALSQAVTSKLTAATADTSLLKIGLLQSEQTITHNAGVVTSHATNALEHISALGGLITLDSLTSEATAALGANAKDASATGNASLLHLNVQGILDVQVLNDLKTKLSSGVLPADLTQQLEAALNGLTDTLKSALGAVLVMPKTGSIVKTDNKVSAEESAAHLVVQPVGFAKPIIDLALVPAQASVERAQAAVPPAVVTPAKAGSAPHSLATTGAELPLTGAVAAALMGLAAIARRRRAGLAE